MMPIFTLGKPVAVCTWLKKSTLLIHTTMTPRQPTAKNRVVIGCGCAWVSMVLIGCQTVATPQPATQTAHALMQQTLLHRFDQSYDYQKTTHYQVASLYPSNDVEQRDHSLFFTMLQLFAGDNQYPKTRAITHQQRECEEKYTRGYQAIINQALAKSPPPRDTADTATTALTVEQVNAMLDKEQAAYEQCAGQAQADNSGIKPANDYTTIGSITAQQPTDNSYQTTVNKLVTFFTMLANNMQAPEEQTPTTDAKAQLPILTPNNRAPQKYSEPLERPPSDASSSPAQSDTSTPSSDSRTGNTGANIINLLRNLRITPEQIQVLNDAYLSPKTIRHQGSYDHATGQFSSVLEERSDRPYAQSYKRIPMLIDFNEMSVTFEPDAVLPFVGLLFDKELPESLSGQSIKFVLPEDLRQNIPLPLLRATLIEAIGQAYGDLDGEKFNELNPKTDDYAQSIHAKRVIKIHLTANDLGFVVGRTLKHWSQALKDIREQHPDYIKNDSNFAATLNLMEATNRLYRAEDLAKITQLIEALLPISYNSYNYYYFDRSNQLIGYRKIRDYQSGLMGARGKAITLSQIHYRTTPEPHRYYHPQPEQIIDGNALIKKITSEQRLRQEAEDARFGYQNSDISADQDSGIPTNQPVEAE